MASPVACTNKAVFLHASLGLGERTSLLATHNVVAARLAFLNHSASGTLAHVARQGNVVQLRLDLVPRLARKRRVCFFLARIARGCHALDVVAFHQLLALGHVGRFALGTLDRLGDNLARPANKTFHHGSQFYNAIWTKRLVLTHKANCLCRQVLATIGAFRGSVLRCDRFHRSNPAVETHGLLTAFHRKKVDVFAKATWAHCVWTSRNGLRLG